MDESIIALYKTLLLGIISTLLSSFSNVICSLLDNIIRISMYYFYDIYLEILHSLRISGDDQHSIAVHPHDKFM